LPQNEDEAMAQARSAGAAAGAAPVVIALGRPRGAVFERALADQDLVVIAGRRERADLAALAASRLPTAARTAVFELPAAVVPRLLAAGGFRLARPMKAMVEQALEGL
jgi:hypothetical protein